MKLSEAFNLALEHHRTARLAEAEKLYLAIIQAQPTHPAANHNLAVIAMQKGNPMLALPHCRTAVESSPDNSQFRITYTEALLAAGFAEQALAEVKKAMRLGVQGSAVEDLRLRVEQACAQQTARLRGVTAGTNRPAVRPGKKKLLKGKVKLSSSQGKRTGHTEEMRLGSLFSAGRYAEMETEARWLSTRYPNKGTGWKFLGFALLLSRRWQESLPLLERAATLQPDDQDARNALGVALENLGRLDEAMTCYQKALALKPDYAEAHNNLGNALRKLKRLEEAVVCYQRSLAFNPDYMVAYTNLGNALQDLGHLEEAVVCYQRSLALNPDYMVAYTNLGNALQDLGRLEEAVICYQRSLALNPDYMAAYTNLGNALQDLGRLEEAMISYQKALTLKPDCPEAHSNLGNALQDFGRLDEAVVCFQKALALKPDYAEAHYNLGNAFRKLSRVDEAVVCHQKALALKPDYAEALNNLGNVLQILGRLDEAVTCYQKALALKPDYTHALSNLLHLYSFSQIVPLKEELLWAQRAEQIFTPDSARILIPKQLKFSSRTGRPLRLGIVSAELGEHAVAYFLEPVLRHFDPRRLKVTLYPTVFRTEDAAKRFRDATDSWVPLVGMSDGRAAERIREDRIDILIDTTGHTHGCRLGIFAHRAAPVQCHYIGYFGTTGLTQMDYFIGDDIVTPVSLDPYFQEKIWRLPRLWYAYSGPEEAPESAWTPAPDGSIWLGSFNKLAKSGEPCLALWAKVLHVLPEARLLLKDKTTVSTGVRERIVNTLAAHGIGEDRVEFAGHVPDWQGHMAQYDRMDIALDTIPFNSATTGFDALWMGVPMITLEGSRMGGRFGTAMLTSLGHPEWVAQSEEEYVEKVVTLARDIDKRRRLRFSQREKMRQSPLCDGAGLARALEDAFEKMFDLLGGKAEG